MATSNFDEIFAGLVKLDYSNVGIRELPTNATTMLNAVKALTEENKRMAMMMYSARVLHKLIKPLVRADIDAAVAAAAAIAGSAAASGGRRKTRKLRKSSRKSRSHRRRA